MHSVNFSKPFSTAHRNSGIHLQNASKALERLSSGKRIGSAADDPAGLGISEKMRGQIRGLHMQIRNYKNEMNTLSIAESNALHTQSLMRRMDELAITAANGTYNDDDRAIMNREYQAFMDEIDYVYKNSKPNLPSEYRESEPAAPSAESVSPDAISTEKTLRETDLLTQENALEASRMLKRAIRAISFTMSQAGADFNILNHRISYLETAALNTTESLHAIEDADMAEEIVNLTKHSLLQKTAQSVMAAAAGEQKKIVSLLMEM